MIGLGAVAIQPRRSVPSHSQIGCRMRLRGRPSASTVATEAHTIEWAISTKAGAIWSSGVMSATLDSEALAPIKTWRSNATGLTQSMRTCCTPLDSPSSYIRHAAPPTTSRCESKSGRACDTTYPDRSRHPRESMRWPGVIQRGPTLRAWLCLWTLSCCRLCRSSRPRRYPTPCHRCRVVTVGRSEAMFAGIFVVTQPHWKMAPQPVHRPYRHSAANRW